MQRSHIIKAYDQEMADLRERYLQRIDSITDRMTAGHGGGEAAGP